MSSINRKGHDESKIGIAVVEGGQKSDPDPQKAGRVRARDPMRQGSLVKTEHLPFIQLMSNVQGFGQHEFTRPPRPGQLIQYVKNLDGYKQVLGILHGVEVPNGSLPGGTNLDSLIPQLREAAKALTGMNIAPIVQQVLEQNKSGLEKLTKQLKEKIEKDRHELYQGLPTHGAIASMAGLIAQPLQQISTALTEQSAQLTSDMVSQIGGSSFSMGSIINQLSSTLQSEIFDNLAPEISAAINNMQTLMSSEEFLASLPGNFVTGGRVNPATFLPKVVEALKNVTTVGELDDAMQGLVNDMFASNALDGIEDVINDVVGMFGDVQRILKANGDIEFTIDSLFQQAQEAFASLASSIPSAAEQLFGNNSQIPDLIKRLKDQSTVGAGKANIENKSPQKKEVRELLYRGRNVTRGSTVLGSE